MPKKPPFDPNAEFTVVEEKPPFNPDKPFEVVDGPGKPVAPPPQVPDQASGGGGASPMASAGSPTELGMSSAAQQQPSPQATTPDATTIAGRSNLFRNYWRAEQQRDALQKELDAMNFEEVRGMSAATSRVNQQFAAAQDALRPYKEAEAKMKPMFDREIDKVMKDADGYDLTMEREGLRYADPSKITAMASGLARRYGLGDDQNFIRHLENRLSDHVGAKLIERDAMDRFEDQESAIRRKGFAKMEQMFQTDDIEAAKANTLLDAATARINQESKQGADAINAGYAQQVEQMKGSFAQREQAYLQQVNAVQQAAQRGQITVEAANQQLDALTKQQNDAVAAFNEQSSAMYARSVQDMSSMNARFNRRFEDEQRRIIAGAEARIKAAAEKFAMEFGDSEEGKQMRSDMRKAYEKAWKDAAAARGAMIDATAKERFAKDYFLAGPMSAIGARFGESVVEGLGGALKGIGTTVGDETMNLLGREMQAAFVLPEARSNSFNDLLDGANLAQVSGQLIGGMLPSVAASAGVAAATGGAGTPVALQMLAAGTAGWGMETAQISGDIRDRVFQETGSRSKADDAAWKAFVSQVQLAPAYAFEGLPFVGNALDFIPTKGLRAGAGAATEYGTELFQEIPQAIAEQNILDGKEPYEDFGDALEKMSDSGELKKLLVTMAPISLLGAGGQVASQSNKQRLEDAVKSYIAKHEVAKYAEGASGQWINSMIERGGDNFAASVIQGMLSGGQIDQRKATELLMEKDKVNAARSEASRLRLREQDARAYVGLSATRNALLKMAETLPDGVEKTILSKRAAEIERSLVDFAIEGKQEYVRVRYADGSSTLLDKYAAMRMLNDPDFILEVAKQIDVMGIDFVGEASQESVSRFHESVIRAQDEMKAKAQADRVNKSKPKAPSITIDGLTPEEAANKEEIAKLQDQYDKAELKSEVTGKPMPEGMVRPESPEAEDPIAGTALEGIVGGRATYSLPSGEKVVGDVYLDGQTVVIETPDRIYEVGNVNDLASTEGDIPLTAIAPTITVDENGSFIYSGNDDGIAHGAIVPQGAGLKAIKRDKDGNIKRIVVTDADGNTKNLRGQEAEDMAYYMMLRAVENNQSTLTRDDSIKEEIDSEFDRKTQVPSAPKADADTQARIGARDGGGVKQVEQKGAGSSAPPASSPVRREGQPQEQPKKPKKRKDERVDIREDSSAGSDVGLDDERRAVMPAPPPPAQAPPGVQAEAGEVASTPSHGRSIESGGIGATPRNRRSEQGSEISEPFKPTESADVFRRRMLDTIMSGPITEALRSGKMPEGMTGIGAGFVDDKKIELRKDGDGYAAYYTGEIAWTADKKKADELRRQAKSKKPIARFDTVEDAVRWAIENLPSTRQLVENEASAAAQTEEVALPPKEMASKKPAKPETKEPSPKAEKPKEEAKPAEKAKPIAEGAKAIADRIRAGKLKGGGLKSAVPGFEQAWDAALEAAAVAIEAGGDAAQAISDAIAALKASDWWKKADKADREKRQKELTDHVGESTSEENPKRAEPKEGREVKKTILTQRAYEGDFRKEVKEELKKIGLTRKTETHEEAKEKADKIIEKLGVWAALDAVMANDVKGGAKAYIFTAALKDLDEQFNNATSQEELEALAKKKAEIISEMSDEFTSGGQAASALASIYAYEDLGFKSEFLAQEWEMRTGEKPSDEQMARWKEQDKEIDELKKKLAEAEKRAKEADEKASVDAIKESIRKQKAREAGKTNTRRAKELADRFRTLKTKPFVFTDSQGNRVEVRQMGIDFNELIEIGAKAIEAAGELADKVAAAMNAIIERLKSSAFYNALSDADKKAFLQQLEDEVRGTLDEDIEEGRIRIPKKLIRAAVEAGAEDINTLVAVIKEQIKDDYPDITDREVRDAITEYGKVVSMSKDEIDAKIRRMKRMGRDLSILEDIQEQKRPLRSGLQRDKLDAEERAMKKRIREAMKELPVDEEAQERELKSALDAAKTRVRNRIEDLQREIEMRERIRKSTKAVEPDSELEALIEQKDELEAIREQVFEDAGLLQEEKMERLIAATERSAERYEQRVKDRDLENKKPYPVQETPELRAARERRDAAKAELKALQERMGVIRKNRLEAAKKAAGKYIENLERRIREKDFAPKERKPIVADTELVALNAEKLRMRERFDKELHKHRILNRTKAEKAKDTAIEAWQLFRYMNASLDLSFIGIQGVAMTISNLWRNPSAVATAFRNMRRSMASEQKSEEWHRRIRAQSWYPAAKKAGLAITEPHAEITAREELFMSEWTRAIWNAIGLPARIHSKEAHERWMKLNPFRAVERAATAYLDSLRIERYLSGLAILEQKMAEGEEVTEKDREDIADMVNTLTGRGSLGPAEKIAKGLSLALYSPRLWASAVKTSTPYALWYFGNLSPTARKMALQDMGRFIGTTTALVLMAALYFNNDDDEETGVEFDPRSSDFLKIKIGKNRRLDPWGGKIQQVVFSTRLAIGALSLASEQMGGKPIPAYKKASGEVFPLGMKYKSPSMGKLGMQMLTNKLAPAASLAVETGFSNISEEGGKVVRRDDFGNEILLSEQFIERLTPMYAQTLMELAKEDPGAVEGLLMLSSFIAYPNLQEYEKKAGKGSELMSPEERIKRRKASFDKRMEKAGGAGE